MRFDPQLDHLLAADLSNLYLCMNKFKNFLESKIHFLGNLPHAERSEDDCIQALESLEEAYNLAVELRVPECAEILGKPGPVTVRLLEALNSIPESDYLTPPEIAEQLGAAPETVIGWIKSGQLKGANLATDHRPRYVVTPDDLAKFLESRQPQPPVKRQPKAKPAYKRFSE